MIKKVTVAESAVAFSFFRAGGFGIPSRQFADYTLIDPPETDAEGDTRGFSIMQPPFGPNLVAATRMRDTALKRVLEDLPIGTELKLDARYGDFVLHTTESKPAVFVIAAIGATPVRCTFARANRDRTNHDLALLHASHTEAQLALRDDFERKARDTPNFTCIMTVQEQTEGWKGERGQVNAETVKKYVPDLARPNHYLSGAEGMVKTMRKLLVNLKVNEDNIRTEEFEG